MVSLQLGGNTPHQGRRCQFITNPDMEGYLPTTLPLFGVANHDPVPWVVVSVMGFTIWWHQQAVTSFPQPNVHVPSDVHTHYMLPEVFTHHQWILWWDVHGRSHNIPLIYPREVFLAEHWVTTWPLLSFSVIISSLPLEAGLHWVGLVHLSHAWWTTIHKGMPTSDTMKRSWFWQKMCDLPCWSATSQEETSVTIWCTTLHVSSSHLSLIFLFPLKASAFTKTRSPGFRFMTPIFQS